MMTAPSFQDLFALGRAEHLLRRPDLDIRPGSETDMYLAAAAAMGDRVLGYTTERFGVTYLDVARGDDLTRLARDHWQVDRDEATFAIGQVTLARTTTASARTIDAGTRVATQPDENGDFQTFLLDDDLLLGVGVASGMVAATCADAGQQGNVIAGAINRILDTLPADGFTVTNDARFVGGAPEQTDEELRAEVRAIPRTQRRGTAEAVEFGAKRVESVQVATVTEMEEIGMASVYVTDFEGNSNAAMVANVKVELLTWRAAGACVQVLGGELYEQTIAVQLLVRTGVNIPAIAALVRQAITSAVNKLGIGATLYRGLIQAAARDVDRNAIIEVVVVTPGADVEPDDNQVIRTSVNLVDVT